MTRRLFQIKT